MNNVNGPVEVKIPFESQHKFSIAVNSGHPSYATEKISEAFAVRAIPILFIGVTRK